MENLLIKLRNREEVARDRVADVVADAEGTFFSDRTARPLVYSVSDGYFSFSKSNINEIKKRLSHPNLFGVVFDVLVKPSTIAITDYIVISCAGEAA